MRESPGIFLPEDTGALLHTQRTGGKNPSVGHGLDRGGNGLAASLATDSEVAKPGLGQIPHRNSIGEYKAKHVQWIEGTSGQVVVSAPIGHRTTDGRMVRLVASRIR